MVNYVKEIYAPFTDEEISAKMVELLTPKGTKAKVEIVYQPLEGLQRPGDHRGDSRRGFRPRRTLRAPALRLLRLREPG